MIWCDCRGFLFLFCSFLVNFTNLSWKQFNIILIYWVELYCYLRVYFLFFYSCFLFCFCLVPGVGVGGALAFMKKTGLRQHTINYICTSLLHLVFPFPPNLIAVWMWCGLQLVLWFHLLALLNPGSTFRLHGFIWRSADKVPAWISEQLLVPCNWWHPLDACWSACKTKPLQTGVKCSWVFYRITVAWSCHCFAWEQMID